jgi:hypothetical protein
MPNATLVYSSRLHSRNHITVYYANNTNWNATKLIDAIIAASKQRKNRVVPKDNTFVFMNRAVRKKNVGQ